MKIAWLAAITVCGVALLLAPGCDGHHDGSAATASTEAEPGASPAPFSAAQEVAAPTTAPGPDEAEPEEPEQPHPAAATTAPTTAAARATWPRRSGACPTT